MLRAMVHTTATVRRRFAGDAARATAVAPPRCADVPIQELIPRNVVHLAHPP
jgi:hypothetical protein